MANTLLHNEPPPVAAVEPLVEQLEPLPDPRQVLLRLCREKHCLFLDSALQEAPLGRFSFLTADPFDYIQAPADGSDALAELRRRMAELPIVPLADLPPFQGGAAGLFGYDLGRSLECVPRPKYDEFGAPALSIGLYDVVLAWDHVAGRAWIISQGLPETDPAKRRRRAAQRLRQFKSWLHESEPASPPRRCDQNPESTVAAAQLAPQFPVAQRLKLTSNFSAQTYRRAIERAIEYIYAGDVFQVNLAQRLLCPAREHAVDLYLRLREKNPAPFAGYFDLGDFQIVSASPERFLQVRDRYVEARPIKGTRPRVGDADADRRAGDELRQSEKDRAENVMIVDLLRNDISRVCKPRSVCVPKLCGLETYETVQHLVSSIRGELCEDRGALDLVRAAFPGGSITGAPKIRAMEIIAELEPTARGPYCGSLGYLGFDGSLDLSILIRTITAGRGWWQLPVGGGIVAQSDPQREYEETWHKAEGLLRAI